jgi:hypothetical protein
MKRPVSVPHINVEMKSHVFLVSERFHLHMVIFHYGSYT